MTSPSLRPADPFLFLLGHRGAIERIAACKGAVWIGAILVLTAGIARNYDHLDLLREPEWCIAPFLVSLISAAVIFLCVNSRLDLYWTHGRRHHFAPFLALFWMTAPCAWLYAIPFEAFTDLLTATKWNVALLAVVSFWRVALITRALRVLTGGPLWAILLAVLVPACVEAWLGSLVSGMSLIGIMGGVRMPPHHEFLLLASSVVQGGSFWLCILLAPLFLFVPRRFTRSPRGLTSPSTRLRRPVWISSIVILALWVAAAAPLQPKMQRRHHLAELLREDQIRSAIRYAIDHGPDGFSSWHYLPPDPFTRGSHYPALFEQMDGSEPEWLRSIWLEQSIEDLKMALGKTPQHYSARFESYRQLPGGLEFLLSREQELRESIGSGPRRSWRSVEDERKSFDEIFAQLKNPKPPTHEDLVHPDTPSSPPPQR